MAGLLVRLRDLDVLTARLRKAIPEEECRGSDAQPLAPLFNDLHERRSQAVRRLTEGLRSDRYRSLLTRLERTEDIPVIEALAGELCRTALPPVAASAWRRLAKAARRLRPSAAVEEFHEVRNVPSGPGIRPSSSSRSWSTGSVATRLDSSALPPGFKICSVSTRTRWSPPPRSSMASP